MDLRIWSSGWWRRAVGWIETVEANGDAREGVHQYATITRDSSSCNQMIREPATSARAQIVVPNPIPARRGMDEAAVPGINGYMADPAALLEQHEVANGHRAGRRRNRDSDAGHLPRGPREVNSLDAVDVLNEPRAIETGTR